MTTFYNNTDKKHNIMRNKLFGSKSQFVNRKPLARRSQSSIVTLLLLLLFSSVVWGQETTLTVYEGTDNNSYVPVYGFYADAYLNCQIVYSADELADMTDGTISKMTFYLSSSAEAAWTGTFKVYLSEINDPTISQFVSTDDVTNVYTGTLDATGSYMDIDFDVTYTYNGGNLLVIVQETETGNYKSASFVGETVSNASVQGYSYSSVSAVSPTQRNFIPKTTFTYTLPAHGNLITLIQPANGTISVSLDGGAAGTSNVYADAGQSVTLTATPNSGYNLGNWNVTGANGTANGNTYTFSMPDNEVTVTADFIPSGSGGLSDTDVLIGSGTSTSMYIPSYDYYDYSLTQQIYTKDEIGGAGKITKIAFYVESNPISRTIDIYMSHTTKSNFTGTSDWVAQSTTYRVKSNFSTFGSAGWNTITLDSPFEYNGTDNLLITVDNNTGNWNSSKTSFYVYSTEGNRAHYGYQDNNDINPESPGSPTYNNLLTTNNQIQLTIERTVYGIIATADPAAGGTVSGSDYYLSGASCTLTATPNDGFEFENWTENDSPVSTNSTYTFTVTEARTLVAHFRQTVTCLKPTNLSMTSLAARSATLGWAANGTEAQWQICLNGNESNLILANTNPYPLTGLSPETEYTVKVRAYCDANDQSDWSNVSTFTTLSAHIAPTVNYDPSTLTAHTVTVTWTGASTNENHQSYDLYYSTSETAPAQSQTPSFSGITATSKELTGLAGETTYYVWVRDNCGIDGYSDWAQTSFTTEIACPAPSGLAVTLTPGNGTIATLTWTETGSATDWVLEYGTASNFTDATSVNVSGTPSANLTGLTAETMTYARVKASCGGIDGESAWSATCNFEPTAKTIVGTPSGTSGYLPTNTNYDYSFTQQIYTVEELGDAGAIKSIDFYMTTTPNYTRNLDIYMVSTNKNSFTSTTDWIAVTDADKVFSGSVPFTADSWTTIELDNDFDYDGTNNVAIIVDDNTGVWSSRYFRTFTASETQSHYCYQDGTDINPGSPSASNNSVTTAKNYIRILKTSCHKPTGLAAGGVTSSSAILSWTSSASNWVLEYSDDNFVSDSHLVDVSSTPHTLTGLTGGTTYYVRVKADCGGGDISGWSASTSFTTELCDEVDKCELTIVLTDAYGDGGGSMQVLNASTREVLESYTLSSGYSAEFSLSVCNGTPLSFVYASTDSWSYENGFVINDPDGNTIVEHVGCSSSGSCSAPTNGEVATYTMSCPTCRKPTNLAVSEAMTSATVTWEASGFGESGYQYLVVSTGNTPNWNNASSTSETSATLGGLTAATTYDVYVRSNCGGGDYSREISKTFTTTLCEPEYMCEIKYRLIDENGDGWEGNAINVVDDATGLVLATLTVDVDMAYAAGTLALCDDRDVTFEWVSGSNASETSYTVIDAFGEVIFSGSDAMTSPFSYTMQCPSCHTPSNPVLSNITTSTVSVAWGPDGDYQVRYRPVQDPILFEDFESGLPGDWTIVDSDGDGDEWYESYNNAHSGTACMTSASWNGSALNPDNWLISPRVQLGGYVSFWAVGQDPAWPLEHFAIFVSTTNTDPTNFTQVSEEFLAYDEYTRYTADLSSYSGEGYIAIRHFNVSNMFRLNIDDFGVYASTPWSEQTTTQPSVDLTNLTATTEYELQVRKDCGGEYSFWSDALVFTTPCNVNAGFPWSEDFEGLSTDYTIPDCWDNKESTCLSSTYKWSYENSLTNGTGHDASKCIRFDSYNSGSGQTNMLKTPLLDLEAVPIATLKFWYKNEYGGDFSVYVSTNGGVTYTNALATGLNASSWTERTYDLTSYCGHNNVVIVFKGTSNGSGYIYLDDVSVTAPRTVTVSGDVVCSGEETTISAAPGAFSDPHFAWSASDPNAGLPADLTTREIIVTPVAGGTYTYTCSVTEGGVGEATIGSVDLTMLQSPTGLDITGDDEVCFGLTTSLSASCSDANATYSWNSGAGTGSPWTTSAITATTNFIVVATSANECSASASKSVAVIVPTASERTTMGLESGNILWTGNSTNWNGTNNWMLYNGSTYTITVTPTSGSNVVIGKYSTCVTGTPTLNVNATANVNNLTIASGTTLNVPDGQVLNIAGNLNNVGTLSAYNALDDTGGTVVFNGNSNQTISNAVTFKDVEFAQTGVGVDTIKAANEITVNGTATFTKGIVKANNMLFDSGASSEDASMSSYVDGTVTKNGDGSSFTFPTGSDGVLGTITATIRSGQNANAKFHHKSSGFDQEHDGYPRWWNQADMCGGDPFNHISNFEYWDFNSSENLSEVTFVSKASSADAHFHDPSEYPDPSDGDVIQVAVHNGTCWSNSGGHLVMSDNNKTITISGVVASRSTRGSAITSFGSKDPSVVLPIEFLSFTATCNGKYAELAWSTASERNNDYFVIERSADAVEFTEVGRVAGAGNSIEQLDYTYNDYGIHGGDNYYRLVQVDYDGTRTVSEIVVANCIESEVDEPEVQAYPNPFNGELTLVLDNFDNRAATIEVYDMLGKLIYTEKASAPQNSYETILNLSNLPSGTYTVRVSTTDFVINRQVVKN